MKLLLVIGLIVFLIKNAVTTEFTDEQYYRLPKLYHLDDYDKCLHEKHGLYCVGKFQLYTDNGTNPTFDIIQEYTKDERHYNRTFLYRGYCLSSRCPSEEGNTSIQFERCVDMEAQSQALRARLHKLDYCQTHDEKQAGEPMDLPKAIFLVTVIAILVMNVIGTAYFWWTKDKDGYKNPYLTLWALNINFKKLFHTSKISHPRFSNLGYIDGLRSLISMLIIIVHVNLVGNKTYQLDPRDNEQHLGSNFALYINALTTFSQIFVLFSSFLTTYNLLVMAEKNKLDLMQLPVFVLKRYIRLLPMYILGSGFSATWWGVSGNGPLWPVLVGKESQYCRKNIFHAIFFLSNILNPCELCILSTWVIVTDMQLHVLILFIILALLKLNDIRKRINILYILYAASVVLTFCIAYINNFRPIFAVDTPDALTDLLMNSPSFTHFYIHPINCLIVAVSGMILGHLHYVTMKYDVKVEEYKWLMRLQPFAYTSFIIWPLTALGFNHVLNDYNSAFYMALDRVVTSICLCFCLYTSANVKGIVNDFLSWNGWKPLSRISFCMSMIHWQINLYVVAVSRNLHEPGFINNVFISGSGFVVVTIFASILLFVLIEYPLETLFNKLFDKFIIRKQIIKPNDKHE